MEVSLSGGKNIDKTINDDVKHLTIKLCQLKYIYIVIERKKIISIAGEPYCFFNVMYTW